MRNGVAPAPATQHADNSQRRLAEVRQSAGAVPWHGLILDDQEKPNQDPTLSRNGNDTKKTPQRARGSERGEEARLGLGAKN